MLGTTYTHERACLSLTLPPFKPQIRQRDANPGEIEGLKTEISKNPSILLCTHFNVLIVSEKFRGLTHTERAALVHEALLREYFQNPGVVGEPQKNFCIRGAAVNDLPHLQHLGGLPFEVMLDLRTPSQYNVMFAPSDEERNSKSRTGIRNLGMDPKMKKLMKSSALKETIKPPVERDVGGKINELQGERARSFNVPCCSPTRCSNPLLLLACANPNRLRPHTPTHPHASPS